MVQQKSKSSNELRSIFEQDIKRNDGHKIQKADDKILSRDGISSWVAYIIYPMEIWLIKFIITTNEVIFNPFLSLEK